MVDSIQKVQRSTKESNYLFSILIPSWNNLKYLMLCIRSLQQNSYLKHQIIVIVNEGKDGTLQWIENQKEIDYVFSPENIGICYGLNAARSLVLSNYIVYMNDDMYALPDWDIMLDERIRELNTKMFMLSSTMIEPTDTGNKCVVVADYGKDTDNFEEKQLLQNYRNLYRNNWLGSTWPPNVLHIDTWDFVGGMSIEYSPGMYSDPDLSMKLYFAGVRIFEGIGKSLVYHFGTKSTKRIKKNDGKNVFLLKWGISAKSFSNDILKRGLDAQSNVVEANISKKFFKKNFLKKILASFKEIGVKY